MRYEKMLSEGFLTSLLKIQVSITQIVNAIGMLLQVLQEENFISDVRFMAGILFKNTILNSTKVSLTKFKDPLLDDLFIKLWEWEQEDLKYGCLMALGVDDP